MGDPVGLPSSTPKTTPTPTTNTSSNTRTTSATPAARPTPAPTSPTSATPTPAEDRNVRNYFSPTGDPAADPNLQAQVRRNMLQANLGPRPEPAPTPAANNNADNAAVTGTGVAGATFRSQISGEPPPLPAGAPGPNMADRHVLDNLNFFKAVKPGEASGNSYLLNRPAAGELDKLYREAYASVPGKEGTVRLSNGQTWSINKTTGKFFPVSGPGIASLTQQEVRLLEMAANQLKNGTKEADVVHNMSRAMAGQKYTISPDMQAALDTVGKKFNLGQPLSRSLAPNLPEAKVPAEAEAAAKSFAEGKPYKFVKWGGRTLLVVGLAMDAYDVYNAENKPKAIAEKAGAWGGSLAAGGAAAKLASPLLAGGPLGWLGYGVAVVGAGAGGYFLGGEAAKTVYEWTFER